MTEYTREQKIADRVTRKLAHGTIEFVDGKGYGSMSHADGVRILFERLYAYEETGLSPDEVNALLSELQTLQQETKRTVPDMSELSEQDYRRIKEIWLMYGSGYLISVLRHLDHLEGIPDIFSPERTAPNGNGW